MLCSCAAEEDSSDRARLLTVTSVGAVPSTIAAIIRGDTNARGARSRMCRSPSDSRSAISAKEFARPILRYNNERRHERERGEEPDVPFPQRFTLGNFCDGIRATKPEVLDPSPRLGHGIEQSLAFLRVHFSSSGGRMNDTLDGDKTWGRPRQLDRGCSSRVGGPVTACRRLGLNRLLVSMTRF